jgi:hypothetical protein
MIEFRTIPTAHIERQRTQNEGSAKGAICVILRDEQINRSVYAWEVMLLKNKCPRPKLLLECAMEYLINFMGIRCCIVRFRHNDFKHCRIQYCYTIKDSIQLIFNVHNILYCIEFRSESLYFCPD